MHYDDEWEKYYGKYDKTGNKCCQKEDVIGIICGGENQYYI